MRTWCAHLSLSNGRKIKISLQAHACISIKPLLQSNELGELQMRKLIITACTILSILMILDSLNAGHALVMFVLAGVIPGTNIAIDAGRMLELFTLLIGFTLSRLTLYLVRLGSVRRQLAY
jgi:hypothetical protein